MRKIKLTFNPGNIYLESKESIFPNPQCWSHPLLPLVAQPINPELAASSPFVSLPLKPHPGAGYWSGSCPIDLILRSLSCSERRMGFTYCFSLLHDWVCATDDTWYCPLPAWRRAVPEPLHIKQTLGFCSGKVRTLLGDSTWASSRPSEPGSLVPFL